jgi:hypothetical protein
MRASGFPVDWSCVHEEANLSQDFSRQSAKGEKLPILTEHFIAVLFGV